MNLLNLFSQYLSLQKNPASDVTVKNYLADIRKFTRWFESEFKRQFQPGLFTHQVISLYKNSLSSTNTQGTLSLNSSDRYLSSLRKFASFLVFTGLITHDPFQILKAETDKKKVEADPWELAAFKNHLYSCRSSHLTVKNYIIDVRQFLEWVTSVSRDTEHYIVTPVNPFETITPKLIEEYKDRLVAVMGLSPVSVNRKLSSLRRYFAFATEKGLLSTTPSVASVAEEKIGHLPQAKSANTLQDLRSQVEALNAEMGDQSVVEPVKKKFSSFPPLRLAQKIAAIGNLAFEAAMITPLAKVASDLYLIRWSAKGSQLFTKLPNKSTQTRMLKHAKVGLDSLSHSRLFASNIKKEFYAPLSVSLNHLPAHRRVWHHARHTRPRWYRKYHSYPVVHYFHFAILAIFMAGIGIAMYRSFVTDPGKNRVAFAAAASPLKILSFQGRLTDASDNPITQSKLLRFTVYSNETSSGSARLWEEVRRVTPDTDGVFSVLLASDGTGGNAPLCNGGSPPASPATSACGIPQSLFRDNAQLWLGITVEWDGELAPRQQLATVAYATNAEVLQGLPPTTDAGVTTNANAVLALNSTGSVVVPGSATTTFQASGGELKITGQPLTLTTNPGTGGNVIIDPDGLGKIDLRRGLVNNTLTNQIPTAAGAVEVDDLFAVLATSSGQSAVTIDQTGTGPIISASASGTARFTVTNSGAGTFADDVAINGDALTTTQNTFSLFDANVSTMTFAQAASSLSIGATSGTTTIRNSTLAITGLIDANGVGTHDIAGTLNLSGNNLSSAGDLTINAGDGQILFANGDTFNIGGVTGQTYNALSDSATTNQGLNSDDDLFIEGDLEVDGTIYIDGNLVGPSAGVSGFWQRNAQALSPYNITDDVLLGGVATSSALIKLGGTSNAISFFNTGGNVGIGDTTPDNPLEVLSTSTQLRLTHTDATDDTTFAVDTNGDLTIDLNATGGQGNLLLADTDTLTIGGIAAGLAYNAISNNGGSPTNPNVTTDNDLYIQGDIDVGGTLYVGGTQIANYWQRTVGNLSPANTNDTISATTSAAVAFTITQTGAFNAVLIEDQASDSTPFIIDQSGNVGIGTTSVTSGAELDVNGDILVAGGGTIDTRAAGALTIGGTTQTGLVLGRSGQSTRIGNLTTDGVVYTSGTNGTLNTEAQLAIARGGTNSIATPTQGGIAYGTGTAYAFTTAGNTGEVLVSAGTGTPTWVAQTALGNWQQLAGTLQQKNTTLDLLIGGTATSSADFAFSGINGTGIPSFVTANGNVGIGTTTPVSRLNVTGNSGFQSLVQINQTGTQTNNDIFTASRSGVTQFVIRNDGNVGIGTGAPAAKLSISGGSGPTQLNIYPGTLDAVDTANWVTLDIPNASNLRIWDNLSVSGNVGIGTTNLSSFALEVQGSIGPEANGTRDLGSTTRYWNNLYVNNIIGGTSGVQGYWQRLNGAIFPVNTGDDLLVGGTATASADFAFTGINGSGIPSFVTANGNVGIGTTTPVSRLNVTGNSGFQSLVQINQTGTQTNNDIFTASRSGVTQFVIKNDGNVGIGTASPQGKFNVAGTGNQKALLQITGDGSQDLFTASASGKTLLAVNNVGSFQQYIATGSARQVHAHTPTTVTDMSSPKGIAIQGKYAYVAENGGLGGLLIFDLTTPSSPSFVGSLMDSANTSLADADGIAVQGKYVYIAAEGDDSLSIIDVSNPKAPREVGSLVDGVGGTQLLGAAGVAVSGKYAYVVASSDDALTVIDISNPTNPVQVGVIKDGVNATALSCPWNVFVQGQYAYVASCADSALSIIDVAAPTNPVEVGVIRDNSAGGTATAILGAEGVFVSGKYAYVTGYAEGLSIIDISNPYSPVQVGALLDDSDGGTANNLAGNEGGIIVVGKYAYITASEGALAIVDVSDPTNPREVDAVRHNLNATRMEYAWGVALYGKYAYVTTWVGSRSLTTIELPGVDAPSVTTGVLAAGTANITGDAFIYNNLSVGSGINVGSNGIFSAGGISIASTQSAQLRVEGTSVGKALAILNQTGNEDIFTASSSGATKFVIDNQGFVGIGRTNPGYDLAINANDTAAYVHLTNTSTGSTTADGALIGMSGLDLEIDNFENGDINLRTNDTIRMKIDENGNVGIGTTTPVSRLNVSGNSGFQSLVQINQLGTQTNNDIFTASRAGVTQFVIKNNGNVGIGTTTPGANLVVSRTAAPSGYSVPNSYLQLGGTETGGDRYISLGFLPSGATYAPSYMGYVTTNNASSENGAIVFGTRTATTDTQPTERLRIASDGNVGIGTTAPLAKFNVQHLGLSGPAASVSADNGMAALTVTNRIGAGDLFTASASGAPRFTITNIGGIKLGTDEGASGECLKSQGAGAAAQWDTCGGGGSLFTDDGNFTYLTATGDDFLLGASTVAAGAFYVDITDGGGPANTTLYLGTNESKNGIITLYSSGTSISDPTISVDASGNLTLQAPQSGAAVIIGDGSGDINLTPGADNIVANLASTGDFLIQDNGSTFAIFTDTGNVGIGTTAPAAKLAVTGDFRVAGNTGFQSLVQINQQGTQTNNDIFTASAAGTPRFTITNAGGIKLGTSEGSNGNCLKSGGTGAAASWAACAPNAVDGFDIDVFTASSTWDADTDAVGIEFAQIIVTAAGGGGGGSDTSAAAGEAAGGGGGAGGTTIEMLTAATLGSGTHTVTVGTGGTAGANTGGTGGTGNTSSFGSFTSANGGVGGQGLSTTATFNSTDGGAGGAATTDGDVETAGGSGDNGIGQNTSSSGGAGGASYWGAGGKGGEMDGTGDETGSNGVAFGSGGGGGATVDSTTGAAGGTGAAGVVVVMSYTASGADLAEWYDTRGGVEPGDIVAISEESLEYQSFALGLQKTSVLEKAVPGKSVAGVVASIPYEVMGGEILKDAKDPKPVALAGRVPVKVSEENGKIKAGDLLTVSSKAGVAMRSTKAGVTIGRALHDADCQEGENEGSCKVMVLVNTSFSNGMLVKEAMKEDGIDLDSVPEGTDVSRIILAKLIDEKQNILATGSAVTSEITTDTLVAGLEVITPKVVADEVETNRLAVLSDSITVAGQTLQEYVEGIVNEVISENIGNWKLEIGNSEGLLSPVVNADRIATNVISPLGDEKLVIDGAVSIGNESTKDKLALSIQGSASVSGNLNAANASVSGTLAAGRIVADDLELSEEGLGRLRDRLSQQNGSSNSATSNVANANRPVQNITTPTPTVIASDSEAPLSGATSSATPRNDNVTAGTSLLEPLIQTEYAPIASSAGDLSYVPNLQADFATFNQGVMVFGPTSLADASVANQLSVGGNLIIADQGINVLGGNLELQPLRQGNVSFMGGLIVINTEGNLSVNGNANFAKNVTIGGKLAVNFLSPIPGEDLIIHLPSVISNEVRDPNRISRDARNDSKFVIQNASGSGVLAVNGLGDLIASGSGQFNKLLAQSLQIIRGVQADTSLTETVASGSAGTAVITRNQLERTVFSPHVREDSLIYITPVSNTGGITPYIARQTAEDPSAGSGQAKKGSFTIAIPQRFSSDIKINWWIVN